DFQGGVEVALEQVRGGANLIDVNMDADLLDSEQAMTTFLNLVATEPEIARVPVMIDSSKWSVIEAGLKCVQGKGVVNSISLKEGDEAFLEKARTARRYGAGGREAIHSAFLYHAIQAGLDMAIVNAGQLTLYQDIPADLLEHVEDIIFDRRPDATERMVTFAGSVRGEATKRERDLAWREGNVEDRLKHALVHGIVDFIEEDTEEARARYARPRDVIEGP